MADMKMNRAVMVGTRTFRRGEEKALDAALTPEEVKALKRKKVLAGDFKGQKDPETDATNEEEPNPTLRAAAVAQERREKLRKEGKKAAPSPKVDDSFKPKLTGKGDKLADDFPAHAELTAAGFATVGDVKANEDDLEKVEGIGAAKAKQIREQLK